jgi:hypothetical protein
LPPNLRKFIKQLFKKAFALERIEEKIQAVA